MEDKLGKRHCDWAAHVRHRGVRGGTVYAMPIWVRVCFPHHVWLGWLSTFSEEMCAVHGSVA